jgi:N-acetylmuramoyl-L-alanine amidase
VGLQVGHWQIGDLPEELSRLRRNSGTAAGGVSEVQVNLDIAQRVAGLLRRDGIVVDVLPATIPPGYDADAFVALHADGVQGTGARGFKLATPWRTSRAAQHLLDSITAEYAAATRLPQDSSITFNMRGYYAFNHFRNRHAVARTTPAVIIEMGFLTNPTDRALLTRQPDRVAAGIANGIQRYLRERDPADGAALLPPEFKLHRAASADGVEMRSAPHDNAPVLARIDAARRFMPIQERDGWFQVFARSGERRLIGWVRKDQVTQTDDPTPTPPPQTS